jgi:hypothetical protein
VESVNWRDLRKTAEDSTKPLPEGMYNVKVDKAEPTKASSSGADMIKTTLVVEDGPHSGRRLWTNFVLSPESPFALNMFFKNLGGFGLGEDFFAELEASGASVETSISVIADALVGRTASGSVTVRQWQGQDRNEINNFVIGGSAAGAPASASGANPGGPPVPGAFGAGSAGLPSTPTAQPSSAAPKINF